MKILQTDKRLNNKINLYGCHFMSLLHLFADDGVQDNVEEIEKLYHTFILNQYMDENCYINEPTKIANLLSKELWSIEFSTEWASTGFHISVIEDVQTNEKHFFCERQGQYSEYNPNPNFKILYNAINGYDHFELLQSVNTNCEMEMCEACQ